MEPRAFFVPRRRHLAVSRCRHTDPWHACVAQVTRREATGTIVDDDAAPTLTLSAPSGTITEGDTGTTNANFTVALSAISERLISVHVVTQAGTAISSGLSADFQALDTIATYQPGSSSPSLTFTVLVIAPSATAADSQPACVARSAIDS